MNNKHTVYGWPNSIAGKLGYLLHELRDDYNVKYSFDFNESTNTAVLTINDKVIGEGGAVELKEAIEQWMCDYWSHYAADNMVYLKTSLTACNTHNDTDYSLAHGIYEGTKRPVPNCTILWGKFFDRICGNGWMYGHTVILRAHHLNRPYNQLIDLVNKWLPNPIN